MTKVVVGAWSILVYDWEKVETSSVLGMNGLLFKFMAGCEVSLSWL